MLRIMLNQNELRRYSRHLPLMGFQGQKTLKNAHVLCVGIGGLGSPATLYLAAAGIGKLTLVDGDEVDLSNLQRQILYTESDIGLNKATCAAKHLQRINPHLIINPIQDFLTENNAPDLITDCEVILDGTDNHATRYLINRYALQFKKPWVFASLMQFKAQMSVFNYQNGPCYQCLYPEPPEPNAIPPCALGGVIGALPGMLGSMQALEVIKIILNKGDVLSGRVLLIDAATMEFKQFTLFKNPACN